ncbi:MAG: hypothetical protein KJO88_02345 [Gammaproteobacteria bacterium]|nr:hypothetical protein [Gammaproteobacteria bacterium]
MHAKIKILIILVASVLLMPVNSLDAASPERYKPFVLAASNADKEFSVVVTETRNALKDAGFTVLGEYTPYADSFVKNAQVIVVTNPELKSIAKASYNGGFAAPWRIAVTETDEAVQVSYVNPEYLKHAYRLQGDVQKVSQSFEKTLGVKEHFGSKKGLSARKLKRYNYTIGMEKFHNVYLLAEHESHAKALETLEANLANNQHGLGKVYRLDLDDEVSVFGISRQGPDEKYRFMDDTFIMQTVDFKEHKGTAYLPYEIMVKGNQILALHMRFRMAVHYPDLSMMGKHSFMTLRPSPREIGWGFGEIAKAVKD